MAPRGFFNFPGQKIWARQFNTEGNTAPTGGYPAKAVNVGCTLWILGSKSEDHGTVISTTQGGATEVLGSYLYPVHDEKRDPLLPEPVFDVQNASFSGSFTTFGSKFSPDHPNIVSQKDGSQTAVLHMAGSPFPPKAYLKSGSSIPLSFAPLVVAAPLKR